MFYFFLNVNILFVQNVLENYKIYAKLDIFLQNIKLVNWNFLS